MNVWECAFGCGPTDDVPTGHDDGGVITIVTACPIHGGAKVAASLPNLTTEAQAGLLRRILNEAQVDVDMFHDVPGYRTAGVLVIDGAVFLSENDMAIVAVLTSPAQETTKTNDEDTRTQDTTTPDQLI